MKQTKISGVNIFKDDDGKGSTFWRVMLGKRFTGGKVIKKSFDTQSAAKKWVKEQHKPKLESGAHYFELKPAQVAEAVDTYKRLDGKASLTEVADYWLKHACPRGGTKLFEAVTEQFITSRQGMNCKATTMRNYRSSIKILNEEFGEVEIHDIRKADIEDWLAELEWKPRTRKNYIVTLTAIFNYAISSDYCAVNPAGNVPRPILDDKPPGILTPAEAQTLLAAALDCMPEMAAPSPSDCLLDCAVRKFVRWTGQRLTWPHGRLKSRQPKPKPASAESSRFKKTYGNGSKSRSARKVTLRRTLMFSASD